MKKNQLLVEKKLDVHQQPFRKMLSICPWYQLRKNIKISILFIAHLQRWVIATKVYWSKRLENPTNYGSEGIHNSQNFNWEREPDIFFIRRFKNLQSVEFKPRRDKLTRNIYKRRTSSWFLGSGNRWKAKEVEIFVMCCWWSDQRRSKRKHWVADSC